MPNFGVLHPEDVEILLNEVTVQGASFSLYKTATVDQMMLEEKYPGMWQIKHEVCFRPDNTEEVRSIIKIFNKDLNEWLEFDNVGDEQTGDCAIKKQFTDADKRAGFACGIGIELKQIPFSLVFPFEELGEKVETGLTNDFGQPLFRIPNKDLIVTDLKYENPESIRRKIIGLTVKCQSSGKCHEFDLTKDPDIKKVVTEEEVKKTKRKTKKENATNVATPTLLPPSDEDTFMKTTEGSEEIPFDSIPAKSVDNDAKKQDSVEEKQPATQPAEVLPLTQPQINTPRFDESDPGSAFVMYGKFKKSGARVRDLKPQEARYLYTSPAADENLKEAIRLFVLSNEEFENDFISKGIALRKAQ